MAAPGDGAAAPGAGPDGAGPGLGGAGGVRAGAGPRGGRRAAEPAVGGRDNLEPTLRFLLEQKKVPGEVMDLLADSGFHTIPAFSAIEDTRAGVRAASKEYFGLDPLVDPANLRVQAAVVEAWETATSRIKALRDEEATARANKLPRQLPQGDLLAMRRTFEAKFFEMEDDIAPSDTYVEWKLETVEDGEQKAESLTQVTSKSQTEDGKLTTSIDNSGTIKIKRGTLEIGLPSNPEELRTRIKTMAICWHYVAMKHGGQPWLQGVTMQVFTDHADYVLGKKVAGLSAKDAEDNVISRPSWALVLQYELQIRKKAAYLINTEGVSLVEALKSARENSVVKERHFTTPMALSASASMGPRGSLEASAWGAGYTAWQPGKGRRGGKAKGKGKDGGKGKGKWGNAQRPPAPTNWHSKTPDGKPICFKYNNQYERCDGRCGMVHCCRICFGRHPVHAHPRARAGAPAAAAAAPGAAAAEAAAPGGTPQ